MKKRILAIFLVLALLGSLIPLATAKGDDHLFEGRYDLAVGMETTDRFNGEEVSGIYPETVSEGILPGDTQSRTYRFYAELYDYKEDEEASEASYLAYWDTYTISAYLRHADDTTTALTLQTAKDGYRKYVEYTFSGAYEGDICFDVYKNDSMVHSIGQDIFIAEATELTKNTDGAYTFSLKNPEPYKHHFYYIDLDKPEAVKVSGRLRANALGDLILTSPTERTLYWKNAKGEENRNSAAVVGQLLMFRVVSTYEYPDAEEGTEQDDYKLDGVIELEIEQPAIRFRQMDWDNENKAHYLDDTRELLPLSELDLRLGYSQPMMLYYGTSLENVPATKAEITRGRAASLQTDTDRDGNLFWHISGDELSMSELTITANGTTYSGDLSVKLPRDGFYSAQVRDGEHYLNRIDRTKLTDDTVWLIGENGYTADELDDMTVLIRGKALDSSRLTRVRRADTAADRYDLKIVLPEAKSFTDEYSLEVQQQMDRGTYYVANAWVSFSSEATSAMVDGYTVGFSWYDEDTGITMINDENWRCGNGTTGEETENYIYMRTVQIAAGIRKLDELGHAYYEIDQKDKVDLEIKKVWIEPIFGYEDLFSLSDASHVDEKDDYTDQNIDVYFRDGCPGAAMIWAEADVTVGNGETETVQVSTLFFISKATIVNLNRPMDDTVEKLNTDLQELAKDLEPGGIYTVYLAPIVYEGVIKIPSVFNCGPDGQDLTLQGDTEGATILYGSIDINDATISCINHITFHGTETATRATYGGAFLNMNRCSFEGYDVAVDATGYSATITLGNVFVNNEIAVRLDVDRARGGANMNPWTYNTFINNGIAVQMRSFNDFISPYYFRVVHSNFINNETDFDLQAPVTVYMYRNYYGRYLPQQGVRPTPGKYADGRNNGRDDLQLDTLLAATTETKLNNIISSYAARIEKISGAKVVSNPRWKYPVLDWWQRSNITISDSIFGASPMLLALTPAAEAEEETPYENVLISDWELETAILNQEAGNLQLSAEAFDADGEKEIEVLDQDETVLGTWTFD